MLTSRQQQVFDFISEYLSQQAMPPTQAEIARAFGFTQKAAAQHLQLIAQKGAIEILPDVSRGIRIVDRKRSVANSDAYLPLIGRVAAGPPLLASEEIEDLVPISPELFRPRADYLRRVVGTSMIDFGIQNGDLIGVKQTPVADNGQIVVAKLFNRAGIEITVKKYRRIHNTIELLPGNSEVEPIIIELEHREDDDSPQIEIEGLYCGHFHRHHG